MKIGIFNFMAPGKRSSDADLYLLRAGKALGHFARIIRKNNCQIIFGDGKTRLLYKGKPFPHFDVVIARAGVLNNVDLRVSTIKQIQLLGIPVVNTYLPIIRAKNKLRTLQILEHEGVPILRTAVIHSREDLDLAQRELKVKMPLILKQPIGSKGIGTAIVETKRAFTSAFDFLAGHKGNEMLLIQEYVKEAKGKDLRIVVVGKKVIAAMERKAPRGEFRANFSLGGSTSLTQISQEEKSIAVKATRALGLDYSGVDILRTNEGPKVIEVNANPGLEGITEVAETDVARAIVEFAIRKAQKHQERGRKRAAAHALSV